MEQSRRDFFKASLAMGVGCWMEQATNAQSTLEDKQALHDRLADEASNIVRNARHTKYQHKGYIDEATGTYYVDCSDYVSYALGRVAKRHLDLIPRESWWPVPRAYKYYDYFQGLPTTAANGWRQVDEMKHVHRGDVIAWRWPGEIEKDHDTGHVFIVADSPKTVNGQLMAVQAYDSSTLTHYDDSRLRNDGAFHDGVGMGTIHFRVDAAGKPTAFQFGPGDHFHEYPIAIGRVEAI